MKVAHFDRNTAERGKTEVLADGMGRGNHAGVVDGEGEKIERSRGECEILAYLF